MINVDKNVTLCTFEVAVSLVAFGQKKIFNPVILFIHSAGGLGPLGEKGMPGPPGLKGAKGDAGYTTVITTVVRNYTTGSQVKESRDPIICVGMEILFNEAPKEGCTLSKEAVTKSLVRQLDKAHDIHYFENMEVKVKVIDDKRQLMVRFNTTVEVEQNIQNKYKNGPQITLPLDQATCNETTSFED